MSQEEEIDELKASLESERDNHMKQSMELERELKEVQHLQDSMIASTLTLTSSTTGDEHAHEIKLDKYVPKVCSDGCISCLFVV